MTGRAGECTLSQAQDVRADAEDPSDVLPDSDAKKRTSVSNLTRLVLWARGAGRCYMCNRGLIGDLMSGVEDRNFGLVAHIVAEKAGGPRGDSARSPRLIDDVSNLMLLCYEHHKLIDVDCPEKYPEQRLLQIKADHELRISTLTEVRPERASHVLRYAANIGRHQSPVLYEEIAFAMLPDRYPAEGRQTLDIELLGSSRTDDEQEYWSIELENLRRQFSRKVAARLERRELHHLSVFALAPQPLLIELGRLIGDITPTAVHQRHREPVGWRWAEDAAPLRIESARREGTGEVIALVAAVSATVGLDRVDAVLGTDADVWALQAVDARNDIMRRADDLLAFRRLVRRTFDQIKALHPRAREIHVFPAMPVSCSVEFGRVWMPKADLPLVIYDENRSLGGFQPAIRIESQ